IRQGSTCRHGHDPAPRPPPRCAPHLMWIEQSGKDADRGGSLRRGRQDVSSDQPRGQRERVALDGWTPLSKAADAGQLEAVKLLLARGANINQTSSGLTPLFCAARHGHLGVARFLVEEGGRLHLNPVLKRSFLNRVYSSQNQDLISLVTQVMTREHSL